MGIFDRLFGNQKVNDLADAVSDAVAGRLANQFQKDFDALNEVESATQRVIDLQKQIAKLEADKDNIVEGFNRKERELEHKTGLVRLEIEAEKKQAEASYNLRVQEAKLEARAVGLAEREKAFAEKMTFIEKRFTEEVGYLKDMVKQMSDRLPDASIIATKEL